MTVVSSNSNGSLSDGIFIHKNKFLVCRMALDPQTKKWEQTTGDEYRGNRSYQYSRYIRQAKNLGLSSRIVVAYSCLDNMANENQKDLNVNRRRSFVIWRMMQKLNTWDHSSNSLLYVREAKSRVFFLVPS